MHHLPAAPSASPSLPEQQHRCLAPTDVQLASLCHHKLELFFFCLFHVVFSSSNLEANPCADMNGINTNLFRLCFPPGVEFLCLVRTLGKTLLLFVLSVSSVSGGSEAKVAVDELVSF